MKSHLNLIYIFLFFLYFFSCQSEHFSIDDYKRVELNGKSKKNALKHFIIKPLDTSTQWDQKIHVLYTNISTDITYEISKTGLKYYYSDSGSPEYKVCITPLVLPPQQTKQLEVMVELFSMNKVAYAFEDDIKVYQLKRK